MNRIQLLSIALMALALVFGCSKGGQLSRAELDILFFADVSNPLPLEGTVSTNWVGEQKRLLESDSMLGGVVEDMKLPERWSVSRQDALARLRSALVVAPHRLRVALTNGTAAASQEVDALQVTVTSEGAELCEALALGLARRFKLRAEELAGKHIQDQLDRAEKGFAAAQEKLNSLNAELQQMQTNNLVPSRYKLSKEYEAEMQAKIRDATKEEAERKAQLASLRTMQGDELRVALVKLERARLASPEVAANPSANTSMLLMVHQAQKTAMEELDLAKRGLVNETNAVAHAELKLEQANRNLTNTIDAYFKSLDIELDVARARRREYAASLDKLKELSVLGERKAAIEREKAGLNLQMISLGSDVERWKIGQRILGESIQIGPVRTAPVSTR